MTSFRPDLKRKGGVRLLHEVFLYKNYYESRSFDNMSRFIIIQNVQVCIKIVPIKRNL